MISSSSVFQMLQNSVLTKFKFTPFQLFLHLIPVLSYVRPGCSEEVFSLVFRNINANGGSFIIKRGYWLLHKAGLGKTGCAVRLCWASLQKMGAEPGSDLAVCQIQIYSCLYKYDSILIGYPYISLLRHHNLLITAGDPCGSRDPDSHSNLLPVK